MNSDRIKVNQQEKRGRLKQRTRSDIRIFFKVSARYTRQRDQAAAHQGKLARCVIVVATKKRGTSQRNTEYQKRRFCNSGGHAALLNEHLWKKHAECRNGRLRNPLIKCP